MKKIPSCCLDNMDTEALILSENPKFPGRRNSMRKYLRDNLKLKCLKGPDNPFDYMMVVFIIDTLGLISNSYIAEKSPSEYIPAEKEALRVVNAMPTWLPAKRNGKKVCVWWSIEIYFRP